MLSRRVVVKKLFFTLLVIMPYSIFIGPNDLFRNLTLCFFGLYFLLNILGCLKNFKLIKYGVNVLDGFLIIFSVSIGVFLMVLAINHPEESGAAFIIFPILAAFIFEGGFGLINNNSGFGFCTRSCKKI